VVHDPYHVVALANQAIDQTRRVLAHALQHEDARILKGSRFLLVRGFEHLADEGREALRVLMKLNRPLYEVYTLKEQLRLFRRPPNVPTAETFLEHWTAQAKDCASRPFRRLAKIKVLKRQAYGFRDMEYFKLRLTFIH
jgi:transposase